MFPRNRKNQKRWRLSQVLRFQWLFCRGRKKMRRSKRRLRSKWWMLRTSVFLRITCRCLSSSTKLKMAKLPFFQLKTRKMQTILSPQPSNTLYQNQLKNSTILNSSLTSHGATLTWISLWWTTLKTRNPSIGPTILLSQSSVKKIIRKDQKVVRICSHPTRCLLSRRRRKRNRIWVRCKVRRWGTQWRTVLFVHFWTRFQMPTVRCANHLFNESSYIDKYI